MGNTTEQPGAERPEETVRSMPKDDAVHKTVDAAERGLMYGRWKIPDFVKRRLDKIERSLMYGIKTRLDVLRDEEAATGRPSSGPATLQAGSRAARRPAELLKHLLEAALEQNRGEAQADYFTHVLEAIVPDEARILSALSDDSAYALIHLAVGGVVGPATRRVVENVSNVGKAAGVQWHEMTPVYIGRLRAFGLIETGPEDPALKLKYEMLESDETVRHAMDRIKKSGMQREQVVRRTLRISPFGKALWLACNSE